MIEDNHRLNAIIIKIYFGDIISQSIVFFMWCSHLWQKKIKKFTKPNEFRKSYSNFL